MGKKLDEDTLTYEKVQSMIDKQLAHIEELENGKADRRKGSKVIPLDAQTNKKTRLKSIWLRIKNIIHLLKSNN